MGCTQSSNGNNAVMLKEQKASLIAINPKDPTTTLKIEELRQPVKRREFAKDEQGSAFDILKKRIQSRRLDMNAHRDDDDDTNDNVSEIE